MIAELSLSTNIIQIHNLLNFLPGIGLSVFVVWMLNFLDLWGFTKFTCLTRKLTMKYFKDPLL